MYWKCDFFQCVSTDSDLSIELDFWLLTPITNSPDTVDNDNQIDDDSIESDKSSDDELEISVSSPIVHKNNNSTCQCHHPLTEKRVGNTAPFFACISYKDVLYMGNSQHYYGYC